MIQATAKACDRAGVATYCNGHDVKAVQLRSRTSGPHGTNEYAGGVVMMCSECRKSNCGGFKIVRAAQTDSKPKPALIEWYRDELERKEP